MKSNKGFASIAVIGIIVLIMVIGGGFGLYYFNPIFNNQKESKYDDRFRAYFNNQALQKKAIENSNPDICKEVTGYFFDAGDYNGDVSKEGAEDECYYIYASNKKDISLCEKISSRCDTYSRCIYNIQEVLNSLSKGSCDKIKSLKMGCGGWELSECSKVVVKATRDTSICDEYFKKYTGDWNGCTAAARE